MRAVLSAAIGAVGATVHSAGRSSQQDCRELGLLEATKVCVVLVDGLGLRQLTERGGHAPFLRRLLPEARAITSGFPTTTASSLAMLGTGERGGTTGMLGYSVRLPGRPDLLNLLDWKDSPLPPARWQRVPTLAEQLRQADDGPWIVSLGPARFASSGLTEAALRGAEYVGADSLEERIDAALRLLGRPGRGVVYLYLNDVDAVGHRHGWRSWQWGDVVTEVDHQVRRLSAGRPRGTQVVLTADHGMVDVPADGRLDIAEIPELRLGVDLVGGEPRAPYLYTREPDAVARRWRDVLGERAWVATASEAVAAGLFGPVDDRVAPAIGDVVVAMRGTGVAVDSRVHSSGAIGLIGVHGSLTEDELLVPFLVAD